MLKQTNQLLNFLKTNALFGLLLMIVFSLSFLAVYYRGAQAWQGITWGAKGICQIYTQWQACQQNIQIERTVNLGIYDFNGNFSDSPHMAIEHLYISWNNIQQVNRLSDQLNSINQNNRWPLITIEPWASENQNRKELLTNITAGKYDPQINQVCQIFSDYNQPVLIRWGHEMENVTGRYPWAVEDAESYIFAYRYFVDSCKNINNQSFYVWSPVGNKELDKYWPGKEYVDYVGVSVYAFPEWDQNNYGRLRDFSENFNEKYARVLKFNKPIIIAELGVTGDESLQQQWLENAFNSFADFPKLKTVVYFNAIDSPEAWGENYPVPDWSINQEMFGWD